MANVKHFSSLSTARILAHKRSGNVLAYLTQNGEAFFLTFGKIVTGRYGQEFKLIGEKMLTASQAHDVLVNVFGVVSSAAAERDAKAGQTANEAAEPILLEVAKVLHTTYEELIKVSSIESPYFSDREVFLSTQKTNAPNLN
jgi:hypothetical protein